MWSRTNHSLVELYTYRIEKIPLSLNTALSLHLTRLVARVRESIIYVKLQRQLILLLLRCDQLRGLFTFDAAPVSDSPKITCGEFDTQPLTFLNSPTNIGLPL